MAETELGHRYRDIERLGAGGMGTVTLAEDTVLGRFVALKRVHASGDPRGMLRLKREALVGASLNHPNLVSVYDARMQDDGDVVIVMEYVRGETLADVIRARGALPPHEALRILRGIGDALNAIHGRGIVHRDLKPANVLLGSDGSVKVADLGVADVADRTRITTTGAIVGSFSCMAPEQLEGAPPAPKMDVYALAALAYELLSGEKARPESNPLALAHAMATQAPPDLTDLRPDLPAEAALVLQRGMATDPATRPNTAGELVSRLNRALEPPEPTQPDGGIGRKARPAALAAVTEAPDAAAKPSAAAPRPRPAGRPGGASPRRSSRLIPALIALALVVVAAVIFVALNSSSGPSSQRSASTAGKARPKSSSSSKSSPGAQPTTTAAQGQTATASSTTTSSGSGSAPGGSPPVPSASAGTPAGVVQAFYQAGAAHQYATAWALADSNLHSQLGGYGAFQSQMSSVRSITFHRAEVVAGASSDSATVTVQTTSVRTQGTQNCQGTATTVRSGGPWRLDRISIGCS
jgi:serine/threonine protein kinase